MNWKQLIEFFWISKEFFEYNLLKRIKIHSLKKTRKVVMVNLELKIHKYPLKLVVLQHQKQGFLIDESSGHQMKPFPAFPLGLWPLIEAVSESAINRIYFLVH